MVSKRAESKSPKAMNNRLTSPPDAVGALYFLPGQYLFKRLEGTREIVKALSSEQISRAFREYRTDTGWITHRVLRYREEPEGNYLLSFVPAGMRTIVIENDLREAIEISLPLPTLVLLGHRNEFYLWAAKDKTVTAQTRLAPAPLPNIGGTVNGKICFGSNEVPQASLETLDAVWQLIFKTPFNRDNSGNKCRSEPEDVRRLLFAIAERKCKRFPGAELLMTGTTIRDVWAKVVEN